MHGDEDQAGAQQGAKDLVEFKRIHRWSLRRRRRGEPVSAVVGGAQLASLLGRLQHV
jgi:hypothetical protein